MSDLPLANNLQDPGAAGPAGAASISPYQGMDPAFALNLHKLMMEVNSMGGNLDLGSGYRSPVDQNNFYNNAVAQVGPQDASKFAATSMQSNHPKGVAGDLAGNARSLDLAQQMGGKYGITFPLANEPWHAEPQGTNQLHDNQGGPLDHAMVTNNPLATGAPGSLGTALDVAGVSQQAPQPDNNAPSQTVGTPATPAPAGPIPKSAANLSMSTDMGQTSKAGLANQQMAQQMAAQMGWSGDQWRYLNNVIMNESSWIDQKNKGGGSAAGIGQNIHGYGPGYEQGNPQQQIQWTLNYVKQRYGTPEAAWQHKLATRGQMGNTTGWY